MSVFGKVDLYRGRRQMVNPAIDVLDTVAEPTTGVLLPVYPQSGKAGVNSWEIRKVASEMLQRAEVRGFADPLDAAVFRSRFEPKAPRLKLAG